MFIVTEYAALNQETLEVSYLLSWTLLAIEESLILIGRSAIQHICVYDVYLRVPFHSIG